MTKKKTDKNEQNRKEREVAEKILDGEEQENPMPLKQIVPVPEDSHKPTIVVLIYVISNIQGYIFS